MNCVSSPTFCTGSNSARLMIRADAWLHGPIKGPVAVSWQTPSCGGKPLKLAQGDEVIVATQLRRAREGRARHHLMHRCCEPPMIVADDPVTRQQLFEMFEGRKQ